ncbi:large ribosomal subunit protein mL64 [Ambystoma mexicanum]|uniref:large ribosomal subunit protein mL64 n=1 Tax=Ambystoma mexicanum TaxID=8296 RepID=UPI0037E76652
MAFGVFISASPKMAALVCMSRCLCRVPALLPPGAASYHARPRRLGLGGPPKEIPDVRWRTGPLFEARLYGRHGEVTGVRPEGLWPSPGELQEMQAEEREWFPSLQEMQQRLRLREEQEDEERRAREKLIAANMAKMPQMVKDWRRSKREMLQKQEEEKARRERLMAEAKERFGSAIDPRSAKFLEMVKEMEKEERKQAKLLKKRQRAESRAAATAPPPPMAANPS